jgi:hypothetical protein
MKSHLSAKLSIKVLPISGRSIDSR